MSVEGYSRHTGSRYDIGDGNDKNKRTADEGTRQAVTEQKIKEIMK